MNDLFDALCLPLTCAKLLRSAVADSFLRGAGHAGTVSQKQSLQTIDNALVLQGLFSMMVPFDDLGLSPREPPWNFHGDQVANCDVQSQSLLFFTVQFGA